MEQLVMMIKKIFNTSKHITDIYISHINIDITQRRYRQQSNVKIKE